MRFFEPKQALEILNNYHNRIVTVVFVKRSNGEVRTLNGMLNVKKYVTGVGMNYDPSKKDLCTIFDLQVAAKLPPEKKANAYRMVNLEKVMEIRCDGQILCP